MTFLGFYNAEVHWHEWHVAEAGLWTLIKLLVLLTPIKLGFLFDSRLLSLLGVLSYSLYLVHMPIVVYVLGALRSEFERIHEG